MSEEQRQSSKLWEPGSFDVYKNAAVLMIAMLGYPVVHANYFYPTLNSYIFALRLTGVSSVI